MSDPALCVEGLNVHYGRAHAVQDVSLELSSGALSLIGRNGMGKSSTCNALVGLKSCTGRIRVAGRDISGASPHAIVRAGVAYVPQGRRVWRSLSVQEHLELAASQGRTGYWTIERVFEQFPRLEERRGNGGAQLSGGEQQMLAISRALLLNPSLLVMDEPTEGLAPIVVREVTEVLRRLAAESDIALLLVEQSLRVAVEVSERVAVMVNGRIAAVLASDELANNRALQQRWLGLGTGLGQPSRDDEHTAAVTSGSQV